MEIICGHEDLRDHCEVPRRTCKRAKVAYYNDPSLTINTNSNRENQNYQYKQIFGWGPKDRLNRSYHWSPMPNKKRTGSDKYRCFVNGVVLNWFRTQDLFDWSLLLLLVSFFFLSSYLFWSHKFILLFHSYLPSIAVAGPCYHFFFVIQPPFYLLSSSTTSWLFCFVCLRRD